MEQLPRGTQSDIVYELQKNQFISGAFRLIFYKTPELFFPCVLRTLCGKSLSKQQKIPAVIKYMQNNRRQDVLISVAEETERQAGDDDGDGPGRRVGHKMKAGKNNTGDNIRHTDAINR